jgi:hypothetical protein
MECAHASRGNASWIYGASSFALPQGVDPDAPTHRVNTKGIAQPFSSDNRHNMAPRFSPFGCFSALLLVLGCLVFSGSLLSSHFFVSESIKTRLALERLDSSHTLKPIRLFNAANHSLSLCIAGVRRQLPLYFSRVPLTLSRACLAS